MRRQRFTPPSLGTPLWTILIPVAMLGMLIVLSSLTIILPPRVPRNLALTHLVPTHTPITNPPSTVATTTTLASTTTTTMAATTSPAPIYLSIVCPANISVPFGSDLSPLATGQPVVTPENNPECETPVVTFSDSDGSEPLPMMAKKTLAIIGETKWEEMRYGVPIPGTRITQDRHPYSFDVNDSPFSLQHQSLARLPSYPKNSLTPLGPFYDVPDTGAAQPDASSAASATHVVTTVNKASGGKLYTVLNADQSVVLGQFDASATLGSGACNTGAQTLEGHVTWDENAGRWLLLERTTYTSGSNRFLCLYVSQGTDPLGMYDSYILTFGSSITPSKPRLGVWRDAYAMTIATSWGNKPLCALSKSRLLNDKVVEMFCAQPVVITAQTQATWAPVHTEGSSPLPPAASTANGNGQGVGALFMRTVDTEYSGLDVTPITDLLQVEHWSSINFTTASYIPLAYDIPFADYDQSNTTLSGGGRLGHPLSYRNRVGKAESIVGTLASSEGAIHWFELVWKKPSPVILEKFVLTQEGTTLGLNHTAPRLPSIAMDAGGTIVITYNVGVNVSNIAAAYRVNSDPLNTLRDTGLIFTSDTLVTSQQEALGWGCANSLTTWPGAGPGGRFFYGNMPWSGLSGTGSWETLSFRLYVGDEVIRRQFKAETVCNVTSCEQYIFLV